MSEHVQIYPWSLKDALEYGERDDWRESYRENCDCARAIERAILEGYNFETFCLDDCCEDVIEKYGFDRVNWVLANTIQQKKDDGRFSQENKAWAEGFFLPDDDVRWHFCVESHPGLTDIFTNQVRREWQKLGLYDVSHCIGDDEYEGKLLVLRPSVLREEYKSPDYQLFYATTGFGCSPNATGRKVYGFFLKDGEETCYNRSCFFGVINEEHLPDWAHEKLAELRGQDDVSEDLTMGGIQ